MWISPKKKLPSENETVLVYIKSIEFVDLATYSETSEFLWTFQHDDTVSMSCNKVDRWCKIPEIGGGVDIETSIEAAILEYHQWPRYFDDFITKVIRVYKELQENKQLVSNGKKLVVLDFNLSKFEIDQINSER